jgi:hypothetical protein
MIQATQHAMKGHRRQLGRLGRPLHHPCAQRLVTGQVFAGDVGDNGI